MTNSPNGLEAMRKLSGYNEKEVAEYLGINHPDVITRWERGYSKPGTVKLLKLCILYGVMVSDLYPHLYKKIAEEMNGKIKNRTARLAKHKNKAKK